MGDRISEEILETHVFASLSFNTVSRASCVSQRWRRAARTLSARFESVSLSGEPAGPENTALLLKALCRLREVELDLLSAPAGLAALPFAACRDTLTMLSADGAGNNSQSRFQVDLEAFLPDAVAGCSNLTALCLRGCALRDDPCCKVVLSLSALRSLDISNTRTGDPALSLLSLSAGDSLRELAMRGSSTLSDAGLLDLARGAPYLQVLDIACSPPGVTDAAAAGLAKGCTALHTLTLTRCVGMTLEVLGIAASLPSLKLLSAAGLKASGGVQQGVPGAATRAYFLALSRCTTLTSLDVSVPVPPWGVSDASMEALTEGGGPPLSTLRLVGCMVGDRGCMRIADSNLAKSLTSLDLTGTSVRNAGVTVIASASTSLQVLRVNSCALIGDAALQALSPPASRLPLAELDLKYADISAEALGGVLSSGKLQVLSVAFCSSLSSVGLERIFDPVLRNASALRVLNLGGLTLEWPLIRMLARLPSLTWLNVTDTLIQGVTPAGCGGSVKGVGSTSKQREAMLKGSGVRCYEYVATISPLPLLVASATPRVKLSPTPRPGSSTHDAGGGGEARDGDGLFSKLETLHTDRSAGIGALLRFIALRCDGKALRRVTLSGDEVNGADILVLAQMCNRLKRVSLRKCNQVDETVIAALRARDILVD